MYKFMYRWRSAIELQNLVMKPKECVFRLAIVLLLVGCGTLTAAQQRKAFEGVSIRPEDPRGSSRPSSRVGAGRFEIVAVRPWELIARAFGIDQLLRIEVPDWAKRDRFTIRAIMPPGATERDVPAMLRTLLEDRFGMRVRIEQRAYPVYELVVLPTGFKFREAAVADDLKRPFSSPAGPAIYDVTGGLPGDELRTIGAPAGPDNPAGVHYITSRTSYVIRTRSGGIREIEAARITMPQFAGHLNPSVDRPVVDKTGLTGIYEIKALLPPARLSPAMQALLGERLDRTPSGISMPRVLNELGLKLEPKETPVDFVIVNSLERPSTD